MSPDTPPSPCVALSPIHHAVINGVRIGWREAVCPDVTDLAATPILLLMGFGSGMEVWPPSLIATLARTRRVLLMDNRGLGTSEADAEPFSIDLFARDALGLLDALEIPRAHLLGYSMGGAIALAMLAQAPERAAKGVIMASFAGGPRSLPIPRDVWPVLCDTSPGWAEWGNRCLALMFPAAFLAANPDVSAWMPPSAGQPDFAMVDRQAEAMDEWNALGVWDALPSIANEILLLTGANDRVVPPQNSEAMVRRLPNATLVELAGAEHGLLYQMPGRVNRIVDQFLAG